MKINELKNIVKGAMKEAIKEELKDILLEALKNNNHSQSSPQTEYNPVQEEQRNNIREQLRNVMNETAASFNTSSFSGNFNPSPTDSSNGSLPNGELSLDQIKKLMG